MLHRVLLLAVPLGLAPACGPGSFVCTDTNQCVDGDRVGVCEPDGACSFPDDACASGRRYGEHARGDRGGRCVPVDGTDTLADSSSTANDPTMSAPTSTVPDPTGVASTGDDGTSGTIATSDTGTDTQPVGTSDDTASAETTGDTPLAFFDAFDRPDADALGNGWIENNEGSFQIVGEQVVVGGDNGNNFRVNVVHRPPEEALRDVEATVEVVFSTPDYAGFPQLHLRIGPNSFGPDNPIDAYVIYLDTTDPKVTPYLSVVRILGGGFANSASADLAPFPGSDQRYRLRARATGIDPVVVEGVLEIEIDGAWQVSTAVTLVDDTETRIVDAGMIGFSGHVTLESFTLDDFGYVEITE